MYCYACQYNLNNLGQNSCPECGKPFDPKDPTTFLSQPIAPLPLLGEERTAALSLFFAGHRILGFLFLLAMQLGVRAFGAGFITMALLISFVEGESGHKRTHWWTMAFTYVVILMCFYVTHTLIPLLRRSGVTDVLKLWSYPLGVLIAVLIFYSSFRP